MQIQGACKCMSLLAKLPAAFTLDIMLVVRGQLRYAAALYWDSVWLGYFVSKPGEPLPDISISP